MNTGYTAVPPTPTGAQPPPLPSAPRGGRGDRLLMVAILCMQVGLLALFLWGRRHPPAAVSGAAPFATQTPPAPAVSAAGDPAAPPIPLPADPLGTLMAPPDGMEAYFDRLRAAMDTDMSALLNLSLGSGSGPLPPQPHTPGSDPFFSAHAAMEGLMNEALKEFRALDDLVRFDEGWSALTRSPALDMRDLGSNYLVVCSLPGLEQSDISVTLEGRLLTIAGQSSFQPRSSFTRQRFEQRVRLPGPVDGARAAAGLTDGMLRIELPKAREEAGASSHTDMAQLL